MFNPSQQDVRRFFFSTYKKAKDNNHLTDLEKIAYSIIIEHPEYNYIFENQDKYINHQWLPELGETNPVLHFSLHMAIIEQLSIDQPLGIKDLYQKMVEKYVSKHEAEHQIMDCLAEMIWHAERNITHPDMNIYLNCINKKLNT